MRTLIAQVLSGIWLALATAAPAQQWTVLFDGKSTDAFRGYQQKSFPTNGWTVEAGALKTVRGAGGDIITRNEYKNFELDFDWKVTTAANSGVMYHVAETADATYTTGPEYQVLDDAKHPDGKDPRTSAASLYALIAAKGKTLRPLGNGTGRELFSTTIMSSIG